LPTLKAISVAANSSHPTLSNFIKTINPILSIIFEALQVKIEMNPKMVQELKRVMSKWRRILRRRESVGFGKLKITTSSKPYQKPVLSVAGSEGSPIRFF